MRLTSALVGFPLLATAILFVVALSVDAPAFVAFLTGLAVAGPFSATLIIARRDDYPWVASVVLAAGSALMAFVLICLAGFIFVMSLGDLGPPD